MQRARHTLLQTRSILGRVAVFWTSRPLLLTAVVALVAAGLTFSSARALTWMETEDFCGRCHTMEPEVVAHAESPHETVECAECHVGSGPWGLVKAKLNGARQMLSIILGDYARPIPPASHAMPPASETCLRCHDPERQRVDHLITQSHFQEDEANTEQRVAQVVRLSGNSAQGTEGIHWHVQAKVEYVERDEEALEIDWIGVEHPDGSYEEFISRSLVDTWWEAGEQAAELRLTGTTHEMSCYDCHNRVGHDFPTASRTIDEALADGRIDRDIPFIKKRGLEVISTHYDSVEEAARAINELAKSYHLEYPNLSLEKPGSVQQAIETLAQIYHRISYPDMEAYPEEYPPYLGHTDSAGCFRCHDGGHYKIEDGRLTEETIPSQCSLCHTFPSTGSQVSSVMLGPPPSSHADRMWVVEHKGGSPDPTDPNCISCHSQTYCNNCHATGAVAVTHDNMLSNHAAVIRETTEQPCTYCHQPIFCERCHQE